MARRVGVLPGQSRLWCAFDSALSSMPRSIDPCSHRSPDPQRPAVPLPVEAERRTHDLYAAFRFGDFALFTAGNLLSITGSRSPWIPFRRCIHSDGCGLEQAKNMAGSGQRLNDCSGPQVRDDIPSLVNSLT